MKERPTSRFRDRAWQEAERYGPDPFVFVRELIQNARDAGATRIDLDVGRLDHAVAITCRDDGEGMSEADARRLLFRLYASGKDGRRGDAGRFGVGFWSILRWQPARLVVRTGNGGGDGVAVELDGDLQVLSYRPEPSLRGTEIRLERPGAGQADTVLAAVREAARRDARFVMRRDGRGPLPVHVAGVAVNEEPALPAPSVAFGRGPRHGVVGLAPEARVELFSRGLRVRTAATLSDLLVSTREPEALPATGLLPQALLFADDVEPLLARGDVREGKRLEASVRRARRELHRLLRRQLRAARPSTLARRLRRLASAPLTRAAAALLAIGIGAASLLPAFRAETPSPVPVATPPRAAASLDALPPSVEAARAPLPYEDLEGRYEGPAADEAGADAAPVDLRYEPAGERPLFAALRVHRGGVAPAGAGEPWHPSPCAEPCLRVTLGHESGGSPMRLPVPSGHRLRTLEAGLRATHAADGLPSITPRAPRGEVSYATSAGPEPTWAAARLASVPEALEPLRRELALSPVASRPSLAVSLVRRRVRYEQSADVVRRHREARDAGLDVVEGALAVGAGDCDVQNAVLVTLLVASGVPARLAVGYVGRDGGVLPGLHAWTEVQEPDGSITVLDASTGPVHPVGRGAPDDAGAASGAPSSGAPGEAAPGGAPGGRSGSLSATALLLLLPLAAPLLLLLRGRRREALEPRPDLAALLRGALAHPDAFGGVTAIESHAIVPARDGGAVTLAEVRAAAARGRLFAAARDGALARAARGRRQLVLDTSTPEARVVADGLGAVDLDAWQARWDATGESGATRAVDAALAACGEDALVRIARDLSSPGALQVMDLGRVGRGLPGRVVLVHPDHPSGPAAGALLAAILPALSLPPGRRRRLLRRIGA